MEKYLPTKVELTVHPNDCSSTKNFEKFNLVLTLVSSVIFKKYGYSTLVTINYKVWEQFITFESIFTSLQYFGPGSLPPHTSIEIN